MKAIYDDSILVLKEILNGNLSFKESFYSTRLNKSKITRKDRRVYSIVINVLKQRPFLEEVFL